jgi:hypothetical protein
MQSVGIPSGVQQSECSDCVAAADEVGEFEAYPFQQNDGIKVYSGSSSHLANADCVGIAFTQ